MSLRRVILSLLALAILLPGTAKANALQFTFDKGVVSVNFLPGSFVSNQTKNTIGTAVPKISTLTGASSVPGGPSFTGSNLGSVGFTSGLQTGSTSSGGFVVTTAYAAGGSIKVVAGSGAFPGISGGTSLFSGTFSGPQSFIWNCLNLSGTNSGKCAANPHNGGNWTLSGAVKTNTLNPTLLTLLGLPFVGGGNFTSVQIDVSLLLSGGVVQTGTITLVPEPGTLALFGTGLMGLAGLIRRRLN